MAKEKLYHVEVTVKYTEACLIKANSKKEAIEIYKKGDFEINVSPYSDENIWNSDNVRTETLGMSDYGDYIWSSAIAREVNKD